MQVSALCTNGASLLSGIAQFPGNVFKLSIFLIYSKCQIRWISTYFISQTLGPMPPHSTVLVCAGTWDKVGIFSRKACSHDLSPRVNDYLSVVYREAQSSWELRTEQSYPRCPARGNNHSTSLEVQFSSHRPGTFFCDQPDALLTPARVGGRQFVIRLSP